jgi:hypothetical protein
MSESTRHRQAFDRYWTLGADRSIEKLQLELRQVGRGVGLRTLYDWSSRFHWQDRLTDLERNAREAEDRQRITAIREMAARQAREALLLQQKGAEWLTSLTTDQVTADAAIRAIVEGARLERLVRGEATERTDDLGRSNSRLEALTDEQLDSLLQYAERALAGEAPSPSG